MDNYGFTIEKIKLQEQDKEAKLKEKRELDATISTLKKSIREALAQSEKLTQETKELIQRTDRMRAQLEISKLQRDALAQQLESSNGQLQDLRTKSDQGISEVWKIRSSLCQTVQSVSDECDIWALLSKPMRMEPVIPQIRGADDADLGLVNEGRLKEAIEKRERIRAERDRLMMEPDCGEEFVRIKNALRYSLEMLANLNNT